MHANGTVAYYLVSVDDRLVPHPMGLPWHQICRVSGSGITYLGLATLICEHTEYSVECFAYSGRKPSREGAIIPV